MRRTTVPSRGLSGPTCSVSCSIGQQRCEPRRLSHDIYWTGFASCVYSFGDVRSLTPTTFLESQGNTFTPNMCQTVLENDRSGLGCSTSRAEFAQKQAALRGRKVFVIGDGRCCCRWRRGSNAARMHTEPE